MHHQALLAFAMLVWATSGLAHGTSSHPRAENSPGPRAGYAFPVPQPGSYALPPIKAAADGEVLDESGRTRHLKEVIGARITVLAFIYTRCGDICPAATLQFSALRDLAAREPDVSNGMQLLSMSFDPDHDTPEVMREHAAHWRTDDLDEPTWLFLTVPSREALAPILAAYEQTIAPKLNANAPTGPLHHIFRAFLIDRTGVIRNIYSLDFLEPELVMADVKTLLIESEMTEGTSTSQP